MAARIARPAPVMRDGIRSVDESWHENASHKRGYAALKRQDCGGSFERRGSPSAYTLTRICPMEYIKRVESVFEIIAEPNRRAILSLLVSSQQSVGNIERQLGMPQPTVSKHLRVLREAGFVECTVDAQRRLYRLRPEALQEVDAWLAPFRRFWSAHVDALERHLDRMDQSTPTKEIQDEINAGGEDD
jgi:DNA-binding transcriptional ArsR family regulator